MKQTCKHGHESHLCSHCESENVAILEWEQGVLKRIALWITLISASIVIGATACRGAEKQFDGASQTKPRHPERVAQAGMPGGYSRSAPSIISDRFLSALAMVESSKRNGAVGDSGLARGAFQFHKGAWDDVSALRLLRGTNYYRYDQAVNYAVAREYARERCLWLQAQLTVAMDRQPTAGEIYAAYNCGLTRFVIERGCKLSRCPRSTRDAAKRLEALL